MQKRIILGLSFLAQLIGLPLFSQHVSKAPPVKKELEKSLLWKVSGKDLKRPSFIFGTMHAICMDDYFFTESMTNAFESTTQLVLEVDLAHTIPGEEFQENMLLTQGKTLRDFFENEDQYNDFAAKLRVQSEIDVESFKAFKPFVLISALSMKGFACPTTASYEMNLMDMATQKGISIKGLETMDSQLAIFDKMSDTDIRLLLISSLNDGPKNQTDRQLIEAYKQQDITALHNMMSESPEIKGHEKELLIDRNVDWVKQLPDMMKEQSSFVAVGAAHLPGENGVLNLLKKAGYKVEAVN